MYFPSLLTLWSIFFFCACSFIEASDPLVQSEDEALFVRRVIEFWRDEEYSFAKVQIQDFFQKYPESSYKESFWVLLGDIYFREKDYSRALEAYDNVKEISLRNKVWTSQLHSLYQLKNYSKLFDHLLFVSESEEYTLSLDQRELITFYRAEVFLRQELEKEDSSQQENVFLEVKPSYESLLEGKYANMAKRALAEIAQRLGDYQSAADYYLQLADSSHEEERGKMLFQVAAMQAQFDDSSAISTFEKVFSMQGKMAAEAAFNWVTIAFDTKNYQKIVEKREQLLEWVPREKHYYLHFVFGHSYFSLQNHEEAMNHLLLYRSLEKDSKKEEREALLLEIASAFHLGRDEVVNSLVSECFERFPSDLVLAKALFFRILSSKRKNDVKLFERDVKMIMDRFPNFESMDAVYFEWGLFLYGRANWKICHKIFTEIIQKFPESFYVLAAQRHRLNASMYLMALVEGEENEESLQPLRLQFISDLQEALSVEGVISKKQLPEYRLKLAKTLFKLQEYANALGILKRYLEEFSGGDDGELYQVHLLMALCYREEGEQLEKFVFHGEQALAIHSDEKEKSNLHLNLFGAYLKLSQSVEPTESHRYTDRAAEHLYSVLLEGREEVRFENRVWIANYYYDKVKSYMDKHWRHRLESSGLMAEAERARRIFEKILGLHRDYSQFSLNPQMFDLESEIFKLATLLGWMGEREKKLSLLLELHQKQEEVVERKWGLPGKVLLALAETYESLGRDEEAIEKYHSLAKVKKRVDQYAKSKAQLQLSRLELKKLHPISQENSSLEVILKDLKDLQIRKKLDREPIHLEAAMDYAKISSLMVKEELQGSKLLFNLNRVKEDFTVHNDVWSKDYEASRKLYPEKNIIYQAYMLLLDAQIVLLEAKSAREKDRVREAESKEQAAYSLFSTLLKGEFSVSQYLVEKAVEGLKEIDSKFTIQHKEAYETF